MERTLMEDLFDNDQWMKKREDGTWQDKSDPRTWTEEEREEERNYIINCPRKSKEQLSEEKLELMKVLEE